MIAEKATMNNIKLRMMVWGGPGTGKSRFALSFPKPLVADLENSTEWYSNEFDFYRANVNVLNKETKNSTTLIDSLVKEFEEGVYKGIVETLIIDPITDLIDNLEKLSAAAYEKQLQGKLKGKTITELNALQKAQFYGFRKSKIRDILDRILKLPINIILLARDKNQWEQTNQGMAVTGKTFDGVDLLEYLPDIVINFTEYGQATIKKSRIKKISNNMEITNYNEFMNNINEKLSKPKISKIEAMK